MARLYNGADNLSVHINYLDILQLYIVHCTFDIDNVVRGVRVEGYVAGELALDAHIGGLCCNGVGPFAETVVAAVGLHLD